jgi:hypothetical protein
MTPSHRGTDVSAKRDSGSAALVQLNDSVTSLYWLARSRLLVEVGMVLLREYGLE